MELSAQLPAELLALATPPGRAPPELAPPPDGAASATPFDALLLTLGATAIPTGEALPAGGSGLPLPPSDLPEADASDATAPDILAASELLALIVPPATVPPVSPEASGAAASTVPVSTATAPDGGVATLQSLDAGPDRPAAPAIVLPPQLSDAAADISAPPVTAAPRLDGSSDEAAPQQPPAALPPDRAAAAAASAIAQPAPAAASAAAEAVVVPPAARPVELRPSTERRTTSAVASTPADAPRASASPLAQLFDLGSATSTGDATAAAPQPTHAAADPLPLVTTPSAASAASPDAQPIAPAHSPNVSLPHAASALDGSSQTATSLPAQQGGSVDTTAQRWHDALASRVQWLVDHDVGEARIKLNPPELGALDVKISLHDDKTFVQLTAHNAAARDELSQSLPRLRELLSANGLELGGATVSGGRDDRAGRQASTESAARSFDVSAAAEAEPAVRALSARASASSRIDVFA